MSERELLISRIVDREDTPSDWNKLDAIAGDGLVLRTLVDALRDDATLRMAVGQQLAVADRVDLEAAEPGFFARRAWLAQWSGWLAAAAVALLFLATDPRLRRGAAVVEELPPAGPAIDGVVASDPDSLVHELPRVMVETRAIDGTGRFEVIYLRRTLERAVVSEAYETGQDETGQPFRAKADLHRYATEVQRF